MAGAVILGVDLASYQGKPDYAKVAKAGYHFSIAKRSEGTAYLNATYDYNRTGAIAAKLAFGGYHFARASHGDAKEQADYFLARLTLKPWHLLPTLDLEEEGSEYVSNRALADFAQRFGKRVCAEIGTTRLILYTDRNMLENRGLNVARLKSLYLLWLADLTLGPPRPPAGWTTVLHQFDWYGHVPGIAGNVDRDRALVPLDSLTVKAWQK